MMLYKDSNRTPKDKSLSKWKKFRCPETLKMTTKKEKLSKTL
jgi:hypothetical protein